MHWQPTRSARTNFHFVADTINDRQIADALRAALFMIQRIVLLLILLLACSPRMLLGASPVETAAALVAAVRDGAEGANIEIAAGTFELEAPLEPKARMTLRGAGIDKT